MKNTDIDIAMDIILINTPEGVTWNRTDIAYVCDCRPEYIRQLEKEALNKLRNRIAMKGYADGCI